MVELSPPVLFLDDRQGGHDVRRCGITASQTTDRRSPDPGAPAIGDGGDGRFERLACGRGGGGVSEKNGGLPEGWAQATGDDLFRFVRGVSYKKSEVLETQNVPKRYKKWVSDRFLKF